MSNLVNVQFEPYLKTALVQISDKNELKLAEAVRHLVLKYAPLEWPCGHTDPMAHAKDCGCCAIQVASKLKELNEK